MKRFGPAHFECRLTPIGDPTMVVEWLHDGKPLAAANRLRMVNEFGYCSLDYEVAYARDSGVITCRATNKFGVDQTSATLIVKDEKGLVEETQLPEGRKGAHRIDEIERMAHEGGPYGVTAEEETEKMKPEIVLLPEPARVLEGDIARFRCRVTGYPAPKVNWYLNGQLIRKSKRYRLRYDGIYYLEIVDIKSYDAGEKTAGVPSDDFKHKFTFSFDVVSEAPHVISESQNKVCSEGSTALLECIIPDEPAAEVEWYFDDVCLDVSGGKYRVEVDDKVSRLYINSCTYTDAGEYKCVARNKLGEVTNISDVLFQTLCRASLVVLNAKILCCHFLFFCVSVCVCDLKERRLFSSRQFLKMNNTVKLF
uniref:Ig-like domain-containing protein n=1 Tax=Echeneis naucrates TaxID=173247 RepID=A0A665TIB4_ECHNA